MNKVQFLTLVFYVIDFRITCPILYMWLLSVIYCDMVTVTRINDLVFQQWLDPLKMIRKQIHGKCFIVFTDLFEADFMLHHEDIRICY